MPSLEISSIKSRVSVVRLLPDSLAGLEQLWEGLSLTTGVVPPCLTSRTSLVRISHAISRSSLPQHAITHAFIQVLLV